jgi:hypothetical protein
MRMDIYHSHLAKDRSKGETNECFCECVCELISGRDMNDVKQSLLQFFTYKMAVKLYMFSAFMMNQIRGNIRSRFAVSIQQGRLGVLNMKIGQQINQPLKFT